jgi:hypothetical protein
VDYAAPALFRPTAGPGRLGLALHGEDNSKDHTPQVDETVKQQVCRGESIDPVLIIEAEIQQAQKDEGAGAHVRQMPPQELPPEHEDAGSNEGQGQDNIGQGEGMLVFIISRRRIFRRKVNGKEADPEKNESRSSDDGQAAIQPLCALCIFAFSSLDNVILFLVGYFFAFSCFFENGPQPDHRSRRAHEQF